MQDDRLGRSIIDQLDGWVNDLAKGFVPPRVVVENGQSRLELQHHTASAVMIGKVIRATSGIKAALTLADLGFVAESAALLRIVSDFCTEVTAIAEAINSGGELPAAVRTFVDHYFVPKARTREEFDSRERTRFVSREELMKAELRLAQAAKVDGEELRCVHRFLNLGLDAYVHGAYETTMELWNPEIGRFMAGGNLPPQRKDDYLVMVYLKLHEVVVAVEFTAAVLRDARILMIARQTRHTMDDAWPWK
jgi:hypothetical protein